MLIVINPFGGRAAGDQITDVAEIKDILAGESAGNVVATADPEPEPSKPAIASTT
jgi:hypothetical protein